MKDPGFVATLVVEHRPPGPLVDAMLRLSGRMVHHHSADEFARLAWAGRLRPLRVTTEREGFVCLLAQSDSAAPRKEIS